MTTPQPCGTEAAAKRHVRRGEQLCPACLAARRRINADRERGRRVRATGYRWQVLDPDWSGRAACADRDPRMWDGEPVMAEAIAICRGCPVRADCLAAALRDGETFGVRGGMTPLQRAGLRRRRL